MKAYASLDSFFKVANIRISFGIYLVDANDVALFVLVLLSLALFRLTNKYLLGKDLALAIEFSFFIALFWICLTLSRVSPNSSPNSPKVYVLGYPIPYLFSIINFSLGVNLLNNLLTSSLKMVVSIWSSIETSSFSTKSSIVLSSLSPIGVFKDVKVLILLVKNNNSLANFSEILYSFATSSTVGIVLFSAMYALSFLYISPAWTGSLTISALSSKARVIFCLIHHIAYVENLNPLV